MAQTWMARLPWMIRTLFSVPTKFFQQLKKQIFNDFFFLFYHGIVCCVYSLELPHWGDSNEYTQHTIIGKKIEKKKKKQKQKKKKQSLNYRHLLPDLAP